MTWPDREVPFGEEVGVVDEAGIVQMDWFRTKAEAWAAARRYRRDQGGCWYVRAYDP